MIDNMSMSMIKKLCYVNGQIVNERLYNKQTLYTDDLLKDRIKSLSEKLMQSRSIIENKELMQLINEGKIKFIDLKECFRIYGESYAYVLLFKLCSYRNILDLTRHATKFYEM